ncbi:MAG: glycosyltransferase family 4 protein [Nitrospirae bacterium]|nr:glycosyltransferase family 4 protein [Nitrospirota bacterium]
MKTLSTRKIKVCHLTTAHGPFDDRIFHKQCKSLSKAGHEVALIAQHDSDEVVDGVKIIALKKARNRVHRILGLNAMLLYKALRQKADIYHFHDPELLFAGVLLKMLTFKKVIYDVHEDYEKQILSKYWISPGLRKPVSYLAGAMEKFSCRFFDRVITAGSYIKPRFERYAPEVIANYPPLDFAREVNNKSNTVLKVIYAGGLSRERGIDVMLEAMQCLKGKDIELHLLGDTRDSGLIERIKSFKNVKYHGCVPWQEVSGHLLQADIGLALFQPVPAYLHVSGENIIKLFEYMIAGLSVVVSDFPKLKKLVSDINCGISVDPADPEKIAAAIGFLYDNAGLRKQMGLNGRKAVLEKYNWDMECKKLLNIYQSLFSNKLSAEYIKIAE